MTSFHFILGLVIGLFGFPLVAVVVLLIRCWFEDRSQRRDTQNPAGTTYNAWRAGRRSGREDLSRSASPEAKTK